MKTLLRSLLPASARAAAGKAGEKVLVRSLKAAAAEQGLTPWIDRHRRIFPELSRQYTGFEIDSEYLELKVRSQQAFQVSFAAPVLAAHPGTTVVDIGDSSGAHVAALKEMLPDAGHRFLSVNLDPEAVERVKARGFEAVLCRAEELHEKHVKAGIFLSFEMLEHLHDPSSFLHRLSRTQCERMILTVPFVRRTRVALHQIRAGVKRPMTPETTHIFEFSPEDLKLLAAHSGWAVDQERVYLQYPRRHPLSATRAIWREWDFEGFYGLVLRRDPSWSSLYTGWAG